MDEEEREQRSRKKQEDTLARDLKERRLEKSKATLADDQKRMAQAQKDVEAADAYGEQDICDLEAKMRARESRGGEEKAQAEQKEQAEQRAKEEEEQCKRAQAEREQRETEKREKAKQDRAKQEKEKRERREREARERRARGREGQTRRSAPPGTQRRVRARDAAPQAMRQDAQRGRCIAVDPQASRLVGRSRGREPCPECDDVWNYMLQCPGCAIKACAKCRNVLRG